MLKQLITTSLLLASFASNAAWQLNNDTSRVNFVSIKKNTIAEAHYFKKISGELTDNGQLSVSIDLSSVETNIGIRNERMQKMLFNTEKFATVSLAANVQAQLKQLKVNTSKQFTTDATLSLHGIKKSISVTVLATKQGNKDLVISSMMPVIINAADFNLSQGVEALQKVAGLPSIAHAVPVSFVLNFKH